MEVILAGVGKPPHIVSPLSIEVVVKEYGWEQVVELVGMNLGKEVATAGKVLWVKELVFFEAMHSFHVALKGMSCRRNSNVLTFTDSLEEVTVELASI